MSGISAYYASLPEVVICHSTYGDTLMRLQKLEVEHPLDVQKANQSQS